MALLALCVAGAAFSSIPAARDQVGSSKPYNLYAGASLWLMQNTPEGARIFQTDWDDFPRLFFYNSRNTYLIGLDPTYMQLYDADMYDRWVRITQGHEESMSDVIAAEFNSQFVITDLDHAGFLKRAATDPGLAEVYRDNQAAIFEVHPP